MNSKKYTKKDVKKALENKENENVEINTKLANRDLLLEYGPYIIIIVFILIIRAFIATPVSVNGTSMYPTLHNKDIMILYKLSKRVNGINRRDIVVISTDSGRLIKRVIGLPGETIKYRIETNINGIERGILYVNDEVVEEEYLTSKAAAQTCKYDSKLCTDEIVIPEGEYYVMGDNRGNSKDSRLIGTIKYEDIMGKAKLVLFPFNRFGNVK